MSLYVPLIGSGFGVGVGIGGIGVGNSIIAKARGAGPAAGCTIIFHGPKSSGESCAMVVFPYEITLDHSLLSFACTPVEAPRASAKLREIAYLLVFTIYSCLRLCTVQTLKLLTISNVHSTKCATWLTF